MTNMTIMSFLIKNAPFLLFMYWLIEETNAVEYYERTKFDLYKDDICLVLTLTSYVLMDNFLSLFYAFIYNHNLLKILSIMIGLYSQC